MGTRYVLEMKCKKCGHIDDNVYFAPTCGFLEWQCEKCGNVVDLCHKTGISYEDASNINVIKDIIKNIIKNMEIEHGKD